MTGIKRALVSVVMISILLSATGCAVIQHITNNYYNFFGGEKPTEASAQTETQKSSDGSTSSKKATPTPKPTATPTPTPTPVPSLPELRVVTNAYFPPFEYYEDSQMVGVEIDLLEVLFEDSYDLNYEDLEFYVLLDEVQDDENCICVAGITENDERKEKAYFVPYYTNVLWFVVRKDSGICTNDDIINGNCQVGVKLNTTADIYLTDDIGEERLTRYPDVNAAIEALATGEIDAVLTNIEDINRIEADYPDLTGVECAYTCEEFAIAVNKDSDELIQFLENAMDVMQMSNEGTLNSILAKYGVGSYSSPSDPIQNKDGIFWIDGSLLDCPEAELTECLKGLYYDIYYTNALAVYDDPYVWDYKAWTYSDTFDSYLDYYFLGNKYTFFIMEGDVSAVRYEIEGASLDSIVSQYTNVYGEPIHSCIYANGNSIPAGNSGYGYVWAVDGGYLSIFENPYDNVQHIAIQYQVNEYQ